MDEVKKASRNMKSGHEGAVYFIITWPEGPPRHFQGNAAWTQYTRGLEGKHADTDL